MLRSSRSMGELFVSVSELWFSPCQGFQPRAVILLVPGWCCRIFWGELGNGGVCSWSEEMLLCDISTFICCLGEEQGWKVSSVNVSLLPAQLFPEIVWC